MSKNTRRDILRTTVVAGSAAIVSWIGPRTAVAETDSLALHPVAPRTLSYFTPTEFTFIEAAVSRLIPADELGPGAKEAGVTFFIDQQIAGFFGRAETWYMQARGRKGRRSKAISSSLRPLSSIASVS